MKVLKFGGTSLGSPQAVKGVVEIIRQAYTKEPALWIVVSAFSGVTDRLASIAQIARSREIPYKPQLDELKALHCRMIDVLFGNNKNKDTLKKDVEEIFNELWGIVKGVFLLRELTNKSLDLMLSFGERLPALILNGYCKSLGLDTEFLDARNIIVTDDNFGNARVNFEETAKRIKSYFTKSRTITIVTGFIASTDEGIATTLGRGGSDYTASIIGNVLNVNKIQIWTDVDGVMTADPRKVPKAFSIEELSYEEAMELSHFGAKVLNPPAIQPALVKSIPIKILNTFKPDFSGTVIKKKKKSFRSPVTGISSISDISLLRLQGSGMIGVSGISRRLFGALAGANINVILISQASSEHSICVAVLPDAASLAKKLIEKEFELEIKAHIVDGVIIEKELSIVAVVGENMRSTPGISGRLFNALGKNGINVVAIAQGSSELNISVVVYKKDETKALNAIHEAFFLSDTKTIHIFIVGTGLIGSTLLKMINNQLENFKRTQRLEMNIVGITNTRKMIIDEKGVDVSEWRELLSNSEKRASLKEFVKELISLNLPNSIFVDCTASSEVVDFYERIFEASISIVTSNKLSNIGSYKKYKELREAAAKHNVMFLYETNVGAGLPVINTLRDLMVSGDNIIEIEGIFSGTLSYIFNNFTGEKKFSDVVKEAVRKGYTEPDPKIDLSGIDVARKLLILVRETGKAIELNDIKFRSFLPEECIKAKSVEEFFSELEKFDNYFYLMSKEAEEKGKVLRFIGEYQKNKKPKVGLKTVDRFHPFHSMSGNDNVISFTTERYRPMPLVIRGAGAGAEVTAAGVLADIVRVANFYK